MMHVNAICEIGNTVFTAFTNRDGSLSQEALDILNDPLSPEDVVMSDFTKKISGKRLFCLFGDESKVAAAITTIQGMFSANNFKVAGAFTESGLQCGLSYDENGNTVGTANYPITDADLFKFAEDILTYDEDGILTSTTVYLDFWNALSDADKKKEDPFWRTSDYKPRILK